MSTTTDLPEKAVGSSKFLDTIERVGNKVPNPTIMFVYLVGFIAVLSAVLSWAGVSVTDELVTPVPRDEFNQINEHLGGALSIYDSTTGEPAQLPDFVVSEVTVEVRNLLSVEGLRHFFSSFVDNFAGVGAIFGVNLLITPSDSMLVEVTNEVLGKAGMDTLAARSWPAWSSSSRWRSWCAASPTAAARAPC